MSVPLVSILLCQVGTTSSPTLFSGIRDGTMSYAYKDGSAAVFAPRCQGMRPALSIDGAAFDGVPHNLHYTVMGDNEDRENGRPRG